MCVGAQERTLGLLCGCEQLSGSLGCEVAYAFRVWGDGEVLLLLFIIKSMFPLYLNEIALLEMQC